jgi:hypothetical protein
MLETFIGEIRSGKRESAAMSCVSTGSLTVDEKEAWRMLRKELQNIGITPDLFTQHRRLILKTLEGFITQGEIEDFPRDFGEEETETASEAAVINSGHQLDIPAKGSEVEPKKRLNLMARLTSQITRLTTGKPTPQLRYQFHGVCMVCLEDIEVPEPSTLAILKGNGVPKNLPSNLIHWKYMVTPCEHTFHIHCWEQRIDYPLRCPICSEELSLHKETFESISSRKWLGIEEQVDQMPPNTLYRKDPGTGRPVVLFVAVSVFEFTWEHNRLQGGYPDLLYTPGELFNVIAQINECWLAFHQGYPEEIGWVWGKHFRRIGEQLS